MFRRYKDQDKDKDQDKVGDKDTGKDKVRDEGKDKDKVRDVKNGENSAEQELEGVKRKRSASWRFSFPGAMFAKSQYNTNPERGKEKRSGVGRLVCHVAVQHKAHLKPERGKKGSKGSMGYLFANVILKSGRSKVSQFHNNLERGKRFWTSSTVWKFYF